MAKNEMSFTYTEKNIDKYNDARDTMKELVGLGTDLTRYNIVHGTKSVEEEKVKNRVNFELKGYENANKEMVDRLIKFAFEQAGVNTVDFDNLRNDESEMNRARQLMRTNPLIASALFDIEVQVISNINSVEYLQDVMPFVQIKTVGYGNSVTFEHDNRALYPISKIGRNVNTANAFNDLVKPQTLRPINRGGKVKMNRFQILARNYDFGKSMAKLARSFQAAQYQDCVDALFSTTYVNAPFTLDVLTKTGYVTLAERIEGVTGTNARAFGTRLAFGVMSDTTVSSLPNMITSEEYLKNGFVSNIWDVPSFRLGATVNTSTSDFNFRVPNDKILMLPNEAAVLMALESGFYANSIDDSNGDLVYEYSQAWVVEPSMGTIKGVVSL